MIFSRSGWRKGSPPLTVMMVVPSSASRSILRNIFSVATGFEYRNEQQRNRRAPLQPGATGVFQSGNFIKTFIHLGFNEDLQGRSVWDGVFPRIAARQTPMNFRFALPGGAARRLPSARPPRPEV